MSKETNYLLYGLLWIIIYVPTCSVANTFNQNFSNYLRQWWQNNQVPGLAVTVSYPGQPPQTYLYGYANLAEKSLLRNDSLFAIGSISKTFVSAMILRLIAENKLSLDDPVDKWLPQYPHWHDVTVRQLLNMTSGIFRFTNDDNFIQLRRVNPQQSWTAKQLIDIAYQHPNYFSAGTNWQDSNTNYLLLGLIIEKITQQPLVWILGQNFIRPLNLTHTYYISTTIPSALMPLMAHGYQENNDVTGHDFSVYGAAGSMLSTTEDLTLWARALFTQVLPPPQLAALTTVYQYNNPDQPAGSAVGLGIFSLPTRTLGTIWWTAGVVEGYSALLIWIPSQQVAMAVTINRLTSSNYMLLFPQQVLFQYLLNYVGGVNDANVSLPNSPTLPRSGGEGGI